MLLSYCNASFLVVKTSLLYGQCEEELRVDIHLWSSNDRLCIKKNQHTKVRVKMITILCFKFSASKVPQKYSVLDRIKSIQLAFQCLYSNIAVH